MKSAGIATDPSGWGGRSRTSKRCSPTSGERASIGCAYRDVGEELVGRLTAAFVNCDADGGGHLHSFSPCQNLVVGDIAAENLCGLERGCLVGSGE